MGNYSRMDQVKFSKGCLSQILFGPLVNTRVPYRTFQLKVFSEWSRIKITHHHSSSDQNKNN